MHREPLPVQACLSLEVVRAEGAGRGSLPSVYRPQGRQLFVGLLLDAPVFG